MRSSMSRCPVPDLLGFMKGDDIFGLYALPQ